MLIHAWTDPADLVEVGLNLWSNRRFVIGWKGHLYLPGFAGGTASVAALAEALEVQGLDTIAADVCGVFGLFVYDRLLGGWQVMVDNAGLYKIFYTSILASTSFLELSQNNSADRGTIQSETMVEYIAKGAVYEADTFLSGIKKLRSHEILVIDRNRAPRIHIVTKAIIPPKADDGEAVLANFAELARSLAGRRVSADITGGFDTRVIVCLLRHQGLDPELAVSGPPEAEDVVIADQVAELLGRPLFVTGHDLSRLEEELRACFVASDGQGDAVLFHRDWQNARARLARGIEVMCHGAGGAHFKDFFCFQDFPRYGSANVDFGRFYDLRVCPIGMPKHYFTPRGNELVREVRTRSLARFEAYKASTNNESYDRVSYFLRAPEFYGRYCSNYINLGLDIVTPFLEYRNALIGMRLSPWARFFNGWHRRVLTAHCPALAALPTSEGCTASTRLRHVLPDLAGYTGMQLRRVAKKASQRWLGKALFDKLGSVTVNDPGLLPRVRASADFAEALERLKAVDIVAPGLTAAGVRNIHVGRLLTLGLFLREIEGAAGQGVSRQPCDSWRPEREDGGKLSLPRLDGHPRKVGPTSTGSERWRSGGAVGSRPSTRPRR